MARSRGWGGDLPQDDDEARTRILEAARACILQHGAKVSLSMVAQRLEVTRQTVYSYFPSTDELVHAAAVRAGAEVLVRLEERTGAMADPVEASLEMMAMTAGGVRADPVLAAVFGTGDVSFFTSITSAQAMVFGREIYRRYDDALAAAARSEAEVLDLVEWTLRVTASFALDPGSPPRSDTELRAFLRRWIEPGLRDFFAPA